VTSFILPELTVVMASVIVGWIVLWFARHDLGPVAYHLASFPVGLIGWTFVASVSAVTGGSYLSIVSLVGITVFVGGVWALQGRSGGESVRPRPVRVVSFAVAAAAYVASTSLFAASRLTAFSNDAVGGFWPMAVFLEREAAFPAGMIPSRGFLMVSAGALKAALGDEWLYTVYPLLGVVVLLAIGWVLWTTVPDGVRRTTRALIAVLPGVFLLMDPSFLFYSFYVHSQMPSAIYLLLSLMALRFVVDPATGRAAVGARGWLVLSGLSAAGLVLTRPDGLAYVFVPIAVALSVFVDHRRREDDSRAFFGPLLFVVAFAYLTAYAELGVWQSSKLDGKVAASILLVMVASATVSWLARRTGLGDRLKLVSGSVLLAETVVIGAVVLVLAVRVEGVMSSVVFLTANLFEMGGYGPLWYLLTAVVLATLLSGDALRLTAWSSTLFLSVVLFFLVLTMIHGTSHVGRLGWGDSANRVAFHIVPVVIWYVGEVISRILSSTPEGSGRAKPLGGLENSS